MSSESCRYQGGRQGDEKCRERRRQPRVAGLPISPVTWYVLGSFPGTDAEVDGAGEVRIQTEYMQIHA